MTDYTLEKHPLSVQLKDQLYQSSFNFCSDNWLIGNLYDAYQN